MVTVWFIYKYRRADNSMLNVSDFNLHWMLTNLIDKRYDHQTISVHNILRFTYNRLKSEKNTLGKVIKMTKRFTDFIQNKFEVSG